MTYTLWKLIRDVYQHLGRSEVSAATGGTTTTLADSTLAGKGRDARKREFGKVLEKVEELVTILKGREGYPTEGLLHQMVQFARFRDVVVWVVSAVLLAFLGGLGMYLFNLIAQ